MKTQLNVVVRFKKIVLHKKWWVMRSRSKDFVPQTALELNGVLKSSKKQALFHHHFLVPAGFWGLSEYCFGILFHHHFLVPARVPWLGLVSLVLWHCVPSWFPASFWFQLGFRGLFPYFSFLSFLRKRIAFHHDFLVPSGSGFGFRALSPFFSFASFLRNGATTGFFIAHERRGNMVCCCLGSMLV